MSMFEDGYLSLMCSFYSNCEALGYFSKHHKDGVRNLVKLLLLPLNFLKSNSLMTVKI